MSRSVNSMWLSGGADSGIDAGSESILLFETGLEREIPERLVEWGIFGGTAIAGKYSGTDSLLWEDCDIWYLGMVEPVETDRSGMGKRFSAHSLEKPMSL